MYRPLQPRPVPPAQIPFFNKLYLHSVGPGIDPTMAWGTEVDVTKLNAYVAEASARLNIILSPAHLVAKSVAQALRDHPQFNRRVVGRRLYDFRDVNMLMSFQNRGSQQADLLFLKKVDRQPLKVFAENVWSEMGKARRGEDSMGKAKRNAQRYGSFLFGWMLRIDRFITNRLPLPMMVSRLARLHATPVVINMLNFPGAPPLRVYKATQVGSNSWCVHIAFGPTEEKPVVENGQVVIRPLAPLFVRVDHRMGDAVELGRFTATIRDYLTDPARLPKLEEGEPDHDW
jgi:pyruvate/2-oxoglutarate dehydrogenase complex dihydrolipoamide acyltransferase (E2) component